MVLKLYINHEALVKFLQGESSVLTKPTQDETFDTEILVSTQEYEVSATLGAGDTLTIQRKRRVM